MVMETIEKIVQNLGAADVDSDLEIKLMDGILYAFQVRSRYPISGSWSSMNPSNTHKHN